VWGRGGALQCRIGRTRPRMLFMSVSEVDLVQSCREENTQKIVDLVQSCREEDTQKINIGSHRATTEYGGMSLSPKRQQTSCDGVLGRGS
jgi:hypothetical protein